MDVRELDDPAKFKTEEEAELFETYTTYEVTKDGVKTGKIIKRVGKEDLEELARNTNERARKGQPSAITIGHTVSDRYDQDGKLTYRAREEDQPRIVGYVHPWRVKWSEKKQRYVMAGTPHFYAADYEEAKTYPRASVEVWNTLRIVDPVAILRRTPQQPIQWKGQASGRKWHGPTNEQRIRYSMETGPMADGTETSVNDPTAAPSANAPSQEDMDKYSACASAVHPHLKAMHDKFAAELAMQPPPMPATAPGAPAPTTPAVEKPGGPPEKEKEKMSAAEVEAAREIAALKHTLDLMTRQTRRTERQAVLEKLRDVDKYAMDLDAEAKEAEEETPEKFAAHLERIKKHYRQDPSADKPNISGDAGPQQFGAKEQERANALMQERHEELQRLPTWEQRWEKCRRAALNGKWE